MSEKIISPGVFTQERDLSYLQEGISQIGATIISPFEKGPAFIPTVVTTQNELSTKFGTGTFYGMYCAQNYLKSAGVLTLVRILGLGGYSNKMIPLTVSGSSANVNVLAVLAVSSGGLGSGYELDDANVVGTIDNFNLSLSGTDYSASFNSSKSKYITNILGTDPGITTKPAYVFANFGTFQSASIASSTATIVATSSINTLRFNGLNSQGYSEAETPWVISQDVGGDYHQLFKFKTISHGDDINTDIKVGIFNVLFADEVPGSDYGTFGVVVRKYSDSDSRPDVCETFNNATLDPDSVNYLPRLIGDKYGEYKNIGGESKLVYTGDWSNKSNYIRVEMAETSPPKSVIPFGFNSYKTSYPVSGDGAPSMSFVETQIINAETNTRAYLGCDFNDSDTVSHFISLPTYTGNFSTGSNVAFHLDDLAIIGGGTGSIAQRKFLMGFQGGSNGEDPRTTIAQGASITSNNTQRFDCSNATSSGSLAYKKGLDAISNADELDINMILMPGILYKYHSFVSNYAINTCEERQDCFYIMDDNGLQDSIADAVDNVLTLDTNYAATYYPWVKIIDPNSNKPMWSPPSVVMAGVYAFNDKIAQEWFAPAGLNRGGITEAVEAYTRLTHGERDDLYNGRVNPIASFPAQGVVAWGQKTLQAKKSALDRINVRRLLIAVKKFIASSSRYLVFEQNTIATRQRFLSIVNPYLESVQNRAGLYAFKVVMDDTINDPGVIDRNEMRGEIYLQPSKTAEFIIIGFSILPTGAIFPA